jgi:hypothetical protein
VRRTRITAKGMNWDSSDDYQLSWDALYKATSQETKCGGRSDESEEDSTIPYHFGGETEDRARVAGHLDVHQIDIIDLTTENERSPEIPETDLEDDDHETIGRVRSESSST